MVAMDLATTVTIILAMIIMIAMAGIAITMAEDIIAGEEEPKSVSPLENVISIEIDRHSHHSLQGIEKKYKSDRRECQPFGPPG
jgi:hypothetical protein